MISAVFRRGGDVSFVVEELKAVFDPRGGQWVEGKYVPSLLAAIGQVLEDHMIHIGFLPNPAKLRESEAQALPKVVNLQDDPSANDARLGQCPEMRTGQPDAPRRLRHLHQLHLFQMRIKKAPD